MVEVKKAKPSSGMVSKKSAFGGDPKLIDGPDDYAYSKLNPQQFASSVHRQSVPDDVVPEEESIGDTVDVSPSYTPYGDQGFDYPYNASSNQYQYQQYQYPDQYSYHGYQEHHPMRLPNGYHGNPGWYPPSSPYQPSGHPYYPNTRLPPRGNYPLAPNHVPMMPYPNHYPPSNQRRPDYLNPQMGYQGYQPAHEGYYPGPGPQVSKLSPPYAPPKSIHSGTNSHNPPSQQKQSSSDSFDGDTPVSVSGNSSGAFNETGSKNKSQLKRFRQLIEAQTSNVLHVKGLENEQITADLLNSLFSNFGNIQKLLFVKSKKAAFIVYENPDLATIAKEMLSNLRFMECHLKVAARDIRSRSARKRLWRRSSPRREPTKC